VRRAPAQLGALLVAVAATAGAAWATPEAASRAGAAAARVQTLTVIPGGVRHFAHDGRHLAWLTGEVGWGRRCTLRVSFHDLGNGARTALSGCRGRDNGDGLTGLVLAAGRAYWTTWSGGNTWFALDLRTISPADRRVRWLESQSLSNELPGVTLHEPVSDGRSVYFWTSINELSEVGEPGPLVRFDGTRRTRLTQPLRLAALAAGGGRFALGENRTASLCPVGPAWSPDGRRIAFASGSGRGCRGGVWLVNADGGSLRRVAAVGRNPDWSPDGTRLAYQANGRVLVADAGGGPARVAAPAGTDPAWSPDGSRLAFVRDGAVYVVSEDGSDERLLAASARAPDWSPEGRQLAFERTGSPPFQGTVGIDVANVDGSGRLTIVAAGWGVGQPAWSPDGRWIAFSSCEPACGASDGAGSIGLVTPDGARQGLGFLVPTYGVPYSPTWAPDSNRLAFEHEGALHTVTLGDRRSRPLMPPRTVVAVHARSGRTLARLEAEGAVGGLAVSRSATAAIVREGTARRLEIYAPRRRTVPLPRTPTPVLVGASGTTLVLRLGREIHAVDARTGRRRLLARAGAPPIGLSVAGRRVAWAENRGGRAYVRAVEVAP
jgi:TolB protein